MSDQETNNEEKKSHTGLVAGLSAALAAGAMYFYGPEGERRRQNFRGWILKTKGEVLDQLEEAESITKETYNEIVDKAIDKFATERAKKESQIEVVRAELKSDWADIKERVEKQGEELRKAAADEIKKKSQQFSEKIAPDEK